MSSKLTRIAVVLLFVFAFATPRLVAKEKPATQPKIKFSVVIEPLEVEAPRNPDILLEEKYVAVVRGVGAHFSERAFAGIMRDSLKESSDSAELRKYLADQYGRRIYHFVNGKPAQYVQRGRSMEGLYPHPGPGRIIMRPRSSRPVVHEFRILAPTQRRAVELAEALIGAYNAVVTREHAPLVAAIETTQKRLAKLKKEELPKAQKEFDEIDTVTKKLAPWYHPKGLDEKEWSLKVEMAGVEAKRRLAEALLNKGGLTESTQPKVMEIKITNEIELVGLEAQLRQIRQARKMAQDRRTLSGKWTAANNELRKLKREVKNAESHLSGRKRIREELVPFKLEGAVTVHPIQWVKPAPKKKDKAPAGASGRRSPRARPGAGLYSEEDAMMGEPR